MNYAPNPLLSARVREWLNLLGLHNLTNHEDRLEIDREIERRRGCWKCMHKINPFNPLCVCLSREI